MELVIEMRKDARDRKDWAISDLIRDKLSMLHIQLKDGKDGTTWNTDI
jgi:cysteinyl-tRNA synthetase